MSDMNSEILIKILTAYEAGGMEAALAEQKKLTTTTEEQGAATEKTHGSWRAWRAAIHGTAQLAEGNIQGIGHALHGVSQLLGGMAGLGVGAVIGMGASAVAGIISSWREAKEKIEEAKRAQHDYSLEAEQAGRSELLKRELATIGEITAMWEAAVAATDKYRESQARMKSAELDSKLAQLDLEEARAKQGKTKEEQADISAQYKVKRTAVTGEIGVESAQQKHQAALEAQEAFRQSQARANSDQVDLDAKAEAAAQARRDAEAKMNAAGIAPDMDPERTKQAEKDAQEKIKELSSTTTRKLQGGPGGAVSMQDVNKSEAELARDAAEVEKIQAGIEAAKTLASRKTSEEAARTAAEKHKADTDKLFAPDAGKAEQQNVENTRKELQNSKIKANTGNLNADQDLTNHQQTVDENKVKAELAAREKQLREEKEKLKLIGQSAQPFEGIASAEEHEGQVHAGAKGLTKAQRQRYINEEMAGKADQNRVRNVETAGREGNSEQMLKSLHEAAKSGNSTIAEWGKSMLATAEASAKNIDSLHQRIKVLEAKTKEQTNTIRNDY